MSNPTLDTADYSRELIEETIRPALSTHLDSVFQDPQTSKRGQSIPDPDEPGTWPPLVVTALPSSGRVLYPHVVVQEFDDAAAPIDRRKEFMQHDFAVKAIIHATTTTEMYNLRGSTRQYFLDNRAALRDAGFADIEIASSSPEWDSQSKTESWELTVTGLTHTHPDANP